MNSKTPRLKNLMMLSRALTTASDCLCNLVLADEAQLSGMCGTLPTPEQLQTIADQVIELVTETINYQIEQTNHQNLVFIFCPHCENHNIYNRMVANGCSYYKCNNCGIVTTPTKINEVAR